MINRTIIRSHVETDAEDEVIERLIRDAFTAISSRHAIQFVETVASGDIQAEFEWAETAFVRVNATDDLIMLPQTPRLMGAVVEVGEWDADDEAFTALDTDDWQQWSARQLRRNSNGTNVPNGSGWASPVQVEYAVNTVAAERVIIDLLRLGLSYSALDSERAGDYSSSSPQYQRERERILSELVPSMGVA